MTGLSPSSPATPPCRQALPADELRRRSPSRGRGNGFLRPMALLEAVHSLAFVHSALGSRCLRPRRAISRARCLAVIVASPRLLETSCSTIDQMRLVNALCWAKNFGDDAGREEGAPSPEFPL